MKTTDEEGNEPSESTAGASWWLETCEECESTGYNCPMHDGPEWGTE